MTNPNSKYHSIVRTRLLSIMDLSMTFTTKRRKISNFDFPAGLKGRGGMSSPTSSAGDDVVFLTPEHIMLQCKSSTRIKIIDFGLSRTILPGGSIQEMIGTPEFVVLG
uniref:Protein kinase domain-containing protein n=1 Tax=Romanomermis culicivorax TaxID=13658 RepID=A0A915HI20_ROMCU